MNVVILGAGGQLGRQLAKTLPGAVAWTRSQADLTSPIELRQRLTEARPDVVLNAAAFTQVDRAESAPADAFAVNTLGVRDLALVCRDLDCTLVHFSTDYVYGLDRLRSSPYGESDAPGPINAYGSSKLAGETFVRSICPRHFVVRTCGLYGEGGANIVSALLRQAQAGQPIRVVDDQWCMPTSVRDLALAVQQLLGSRAYGLYHLTNAGVCTWRQFAERLLDLMQIDAPIVPIRSAEYVSAAARPGYSVLSNAKWIDAGFAPMRPWQEALQAYTSETAANACLTPAPAS